MKPPPGDLAALMLRVEGTLEAFQYVDHFVETSLLQCIGRVDGSLATAADEYDRPIHAGNLLHLPDKMGIDCPFGSVIPGDVVGAGGMPDKQVLHFTAAVDEHGLGIVVQEIACLGRREMFHT